MATTPASDPETVAEVAPFIWQHVLAPLAANRGLRASGAIAVMRAVLDKIESEALAPCGCMADDAAAGRHDDGCDSGPISAPLDDQGPHI